MAFTSDLFDVVATRAHAGWWRAGDWRGIPASS
jgi:hypothetical protein